MAFSSDVRLSRDQEPVFPDLCVHCLEENPGDLLEISEGTTCWARFVLWWWPARRHRVSVPACVNCRSACLIPRRLANFFSSVLVAVAVVAGFLYFGETPRPYRKWLVIGLCILAILPVTVWQVFRPPPFGMTVFRSSVDYEFRSPDYAQEFARLNDGEAS
ncbi:MAG: hypothetical protein ACYTKC_21560 [Planctomycetota bacterium]